MGLSDFSRVLIHLRKEKGVSQKDAAQALGVSQSLLSHYERGIRECGLLFLVRAADYYGVTADYLLGRSYEKHGTTISVDDLSDEDAAGKGNIGMRSMMPTLNKKLICNSVSVIMDTLARINDRMLLNDVSAYLDLSVYNMFRILYDANPNNPQTLFGAESKLSTYMSDSAMHAALAGIQRRLDEICSKQDDSDALELNQEKIRELYPVLSTSLFNLLQNAENKIGARKK